MSSRWQDLVVALSSVGSPKRIGLCSSKGIPVEELLRAAFPKSDFVLMSDQLIFTHRANEEAHAVQRNFDILWAGFVLAGLEESEAEQFFESVVQQLSVQGCLILATQGKAELQRKREGKVKAEDSPPVSRILKFIRLGYGGGPPGESDSSGLPLVDIRWFEAVLDGSALRILAYLECGDEWGCDILVLRRNNENLPHWRASNEQPSRSVDQSCLVKASFGTQPKRRQHMLFDEDYYCLTYPDVAAAIRQGIILSAYDHYAAFGWREGRQPIDPAETFVARAVPRLSSWVGEIPSSLFKVNEAWSVSPQQQSIDHGWYWLAHDTVRARVNWLASGRVDEDAYGRLAALFRAKGIDLPLAKAISVGCGFGALERDLYRRDMVRDVDAYDIASGAIAEARRLAESEGLIGLRYHLANLEVITLEPHSVDAVFAHSSVHHVENLEALYATVCRALRPHGIFHLNEYIGPTRFQWTDTQLALANAFLDSLPRHLRRLPSGQAKPTLVRPTIQEMIDADPSEAIRSADLVPLLESYFEIIEMRPLGGTLCHIALGGIAQNFDPRSEEDESFLQALFRMEDEAMADGRLESDFAVITAIPRSRP